MFFGDMAELTGLREQIGNHAIIRMVDDAYAWEFADVTGKLPLEAFGEKLGRMGLDGTPLLRKERVSDHTYF